VLLCASFSVMVTSHSLRFRALIINPQWGSMRLLLPPPLRLQRLGRSVADLGGGWGLGGGCSAAQGFAPIVHEGRRTHQRTQFTH
jgi:hypothetical protein